MQIFTPQLLRAHDPFLLMCLPLTLKDDLICLDSQPFPHKRVMSYPLPHPQLPITFLSPSKICQAPLHALSSGSPKLRFFWKDWEASGTISDSRLCYTELGGNNIRPLVISTDLPCGLMFVGCSSRRTNTWAEAKPIAILHLHATLRARAVPPCHTISSGVNVDGVLDLFGLTHSFL